MSNMHFHPPTKDVMKNKVVSALCLFLIVLSLYMTCYMLFFRTTGIDVTKDVEILYRGENGSASVLVRNKNLNYNQRIQKFMDTVTYKVSPNKELTNGDVLRIEASYDEALASSYHINATHLSREVIVSNLPVRYETAKKIPQTLLDKLNEKSNAYLDKNMEAILDDDFTGFYVTSEPTLVGSKRMYRLFLNSKNEEVKDRIVDVYEIIANGEVNTSKTEEKLEPKEDKIYYMITYNEINTSEKILNENIYGEKIITNSKQDLSKESDFEKYCAQKYAEGYKVERIE